METLAEFLVDGDPIHCHHHVYFQNAINVSQLDEESVNLIVTSPPYWSIKDYGNKDQVGFHDSYEEYLENVMKIFVECEKKLSPKGNFCVNVGNQFIKTSDSPKKMFEIMPIYEDLVHLFRKKLPHLAYIGTINWVKTTTSNTSGGGNCMGSQNYPPSGLFFTNREFIFIFRKGGKRTYDPHIKKLSRLTKEENGWLSDEWRFKGERQPHYHGAVFPYELPKRLITLFSMVGDVVLDPFTGTGTTIRAASKLGRNSVGFEIGFGKEIGIDFKSIIQNKIEVSSDYISYPFKKKMNHQLIKNHYHYYDFK